MKFFRITACFLSVITMAFAPYTEAKAKENQQRELLEQYLKNIGIQNKKMTVGEYWRSVRHAYPQNIRTSMDRWVSLNREQLMPTVQVTNFKDANGVEQVRMLLSRDGQSVNITFTGNEDFPMKINGVALSKKEVRDHDLVKIAHRLVKEDSSIRKTYSKGQLPSLRKTNLVLKYGEFKKLTAKQKAEYLIRLRLTMDAAVKVIDKSPGKKRALQELNEKHPWVRAFFFGEDAHAASDLAGKPCVIAGFIASYGENGSCGGATSGTENLSSQARSLGAVCPGDSTPCNPLVYGFDGGGNAHCVARAEIKYATAKCNEKSPLNSDADKKRIIESYLKVKEKKGISLDINGEGQVSEAQLQEVSGYLEKLNGLIMEASKHCEARPETREDQDSACSNLLMRGMDLQAFSGGGETPPAIDGGGTGQLPGGSGGDCHAQKPGSILSGDGQSCLCPDGTEDGTSGGRPACVAINVDSDRYTKKESSCGFFCRNKGWIIGLGVGGLAFGAIWWMTKGKAKNKSQVYTPPAGPSQDICLSPMTLVDGVCQIPAVINPPVIEPPPVQTEGGTNVDTGGGTGGVR